MKIQLLLLALHALQTTNGFSLPVASPYLKVSLSALHSISADQSSNDLDVSRDTKRRTALQSLFGLATSAAALAIGAFPEPSHAEESMFAPKFVQEYEDFTPQPEGWSYRDVKTGQGESPAMGDRAVYEWSGYTIGYFGRPFEAKG